MITMNLDEIVHREVHYCVSSLVSTLASGNGVGPDMAGRDLAALTEQAAELAYPVEDYVEAAREAGADFTLGAGKDYARDFCDRRSIDPYYWDVYEHWIVSDWLADKLIEKGEKVDKNFAGMIIWARTTTGQVISADSVIRSIFQDA
jgi:hypothetical protein